MWYFFSLCIKYSRFIGRNWKKKNWKIEIKIKLLNKIDCFPFFCFLMYNKSFSFVYYKIDDDDVCMRACVYKYVESYLINFIKKNNINNNSYSVNFLTHCVVILCTHFIPEHESYESRYNDIIICIWS